MADALEQLKERLAEVKDLGKVGRLLSWDQQTMMPPAGTGHRAEQFATLSRLAHEKFTDPAVGRLLDELRPLEESLDPDSDDACADPPRAARLREGGERAGVAARGDGARRREANPVWVKAKAETDFASFLPLLERNVELKLQYVDFVADGADERYDVLLDDYEPQAKTAEVRTLFEELKPPLVALIAELRDREVDDSFLTGTSRPSASRRSPTRCSSSSVIGPTAGGSTRPSIRSPRAPGRDDVRITTNYHPDSLESLFSTMHEYGHGLYSHQQPEHLERLPNGRPVLARHPRVAEPALGEPRRPQPPVLAVLLSAAAGDVPRAARRTSTSSGSMPASTRVKPGLIRIQADEVTYGMHVMLRFELEQDIVEGRVELKRSAAALEREDVGVPRRRGARRRARRPPGRPLVGRDRSATSRPTCIGTVASVQIWEAADRDVPDLEEQVGRGEFAPLREWLGGHIHALGRKFSPQETLRRATGSSLSGTAVPRLPPQHVRIGPAAPGRRPGKQTEGGVCMADMLKQKKVAILAADMFERVELEEPRKALEDAGAECEIVSIHDGEIQGFDHFEPANTVKVDRTVEEVRSTTTTRSWFPAGSGTPTSCVATRMRSRSSARSTRPASRWRSSATAHGCSWRPASSAGSASRRGRRSRPTSATQAANGSMPRSSSTATS